MKKTSIVLLLGCSSWACSQDVPDIIVQPTPVIIENSNNCCCDAGTSDMPDTMDMDQPDLSVPDMAVEEDMPDLTMPDMPADMPDMDRCEFDMYEDVPVEECIASRDAILIDPVEEWAWPFDQSETLSNVMMTPVVGDIDGVDVPDVVFAAYNADGTQSQIVAVKGDGSGELWSFSSVVGPGNVRYDVPTETQPNGQPVGGVVSPATAGGIALGDVDGDGAPEVCFVGETAQAMVICVNGSDGSFKWASPPGPVGRDFSWAYPSIANIDGVGAAEVIVADHVYSGADGSLVAAPAISSGIGAPATGSTRLGAISVPVDLDGDGVQEIVAGKTIYRYDGTSTLKVLFEDSYPDGPPAVADLDWDGLPEIVRPAHTPNAGSQIIVVDWDATDGWHVDLDPTTNAPLELPDSLGRTFGGPPTIADFDTTPDAQGNNYPELAIAGSQFYQVYDVMVDVRDVATQDNVITLSYKWSPALSVRDASSSATGSSVFDFEGDGNAEVVYADQNQLFILDGPTGTNRIMSTTSFDAEEHCSSTALEYPVIVDADGDGNTEIVIASNTPRPAPGGQDNSLFEDDCNDGNDWYGVRVISSKKDDWVNSRKVWNQHAYSISNIEEDLSVPARPVENWTIWNNFRTADAEGVPVKFAPDLILLTPQTCDCEGDLVDLAFGIANQGSVDVIDPFVVSVYDASTPTPTVLFQTSVPGLNSGSTEFIGPISVNSAQWPNIKIFVDDAATSIDPWGRVLECEEENNSMGLGEWPCK